MSAILRIYDSPTGIKRKDIGIECKPLIETLTELYPNGFQVETKLYRNFPSSENEIDFFAHENDGITVNENDVFVLVHRPAGVVAVAVVAFAVSFAVSYYLAPSIPDTPTISTQSPNRHSLNEVGGQLNTVRPMQRIPDVYGQFSKVYPDLIAPQLYEYADPRTQRQVSILTPGNGIFAVHEVRIGNSPIVESLTGGSLDSEWFYLPANSNSILAQNEFDESEEVNGQLLRGEKNNSLALTAITNYQSGEDLGSGVQIFFFYTDGSSSPDLSYFFNDLIEDNTFQILNSTVASYNGVWTFDRFEASDNTGRVYTKNTYTGSFGSFNADIQATNASAANAVGFFKLTDNAEEIWLDFLFPRGLKKTNSIRVDVTNTVTSMNFPFLFTYDRDTFDSVAITEKIDMLVADNGVTQENRIYKVSVTRTDIGSTDAQIPDEMKWARLAAVKNFNTSFPVPIIAVERFGDSQPTKSTQNKINAIVSRNIPSFNYLTGTFGLLSAPEDAYPIFMYHAVYVCGRTVEQIAYEELFNSFNAVNSINGDFVHFQYSFSNKNAVAMDELRLIANSSRVMIYEEGTTIRSYPVVRQTIPVFRFTRRHKAVGRETKEFNLKLPSDPDYISLEYYDVEDDAWRTINYSGTWGNTDDPGTIEKKITLSGATNWKQAYNRAALEYELMAKQRTTVTATVTNDALLLSLGDLVYFTDGNDLSSIDGDILAYEEDGADAILTLSESDLTNRLSGGSYTVSLQDTLGNDPVFTVTFFIESENQIRILSYSNPSLAPNIEHQANSTFSFIEDGEEEAGKYTLVGKKPVGREYVEIELKNYDDTVFDIDDLVIPAKPPLRA